MTLEFSVRHNGMHHCNQFACSVLRAATCFYSNQARLQSDKKFLPLASLEVRSVCAKKDAVSQPAVPPPTMSTF
jgi:hypothetical protein